MTPSELEVLRNTAIDLQIALDDAEADHEKAAARVIQLRVQLDVAQERLDAAPGRQDG